MLNFDGVDDQIMILHAPQTIPTHYTVEAWVKPLKAAPMNIIARSNESYPTSAWSHQLRINAQGRLEHYADAEDKFTVSQ